MRRESPFLVKSDDEIREAVADALRFDPRTAVDSVVVRVDDGVVLLTGSVPDLRASRVAGRIAESTHGVRRVKNLLRVRPEIRWTDDRLEEEIRLALERSPFLDDSAEVRVRVRNGRAILEGNVHSAIVQRKAGEIAASLRGVLVVDNRLTVIRHWRYEPDEDIREDVLEQLRWSPYLDEDAIEVSVENGLVTLRGEVETQPMRRLAAKEAFQAGAQAVRNFLTVRRPER
jgi:osmotically-inducible protein OsmY